MASAFELYAAQDQEVLFSGLRTLSQSLGTRRARSEAGIDPEDLDFLCDHMVIVRPHERIGRFQFEYCGATWSRMSRSGDISYVPFVELFRDSRTHDDLAGYAHVARMKMGHLSRNRRFVGGNTAYYTRLLLPQIRRGQVVSIIGATMFHDVAFGEDVRPVEPPVLENLAV